MNIIDPLFVVQTRRATEMPQSLVYEAMHQDYSEDFVPYQLPTVEAIVNEAKAGKLIIKHLLEGGKGHYGPFEHPQITLAVGYFPHSMMQQLRTHRVGISFDVQSFRYTGERLIKAARDELEIEQVIYLRPPGKYSDRFGHKVDYTEEMRNIDLKFAHQMLLHYEWRVSQGVPYEQARSLIPFDVRQHFYVSMNARTLMHLLNVRWKADAQPEAQAWAELTFQEFSKWMPEVAQFYYEHLAKKARLSA